jgi:hypothetical protein
MKGILFMIGVFGIMMMGTNNQKDLSQLRLVTAQFQRLEAAQAAGYGLVSGPNQCLKNSGLGGLGYRYINTSLIDAKVDFLKPEVLVYVPASNGALQLGAVEYIVPVAAWNATHTGWPQLMGHQFHLNSNLEVYVLHIWVWENNPSGMFEDWNPKVSCA